MDNNDIIFAYTRQDAIDDGVFVDVSEMAKEAGVKMPVAVSRNLYDTYINPDPMPSGQDEKGRLWDLLSMFVFGVRAGKADGNFMTFTVRFGRKNVEVWSVCEAQSPTDPSPAINIFLPEDN